MGLPDLLDHLPEHLQEQPAFAVPACCAAPEVAKVADRKVRKMLEMLCQEAGFLVDPKVAAALASMDKDEQAVHKADSILKALGVESEADVRVLLG